MKTAIIVAAALLLGSAASAQQWAAGEMHPVDHKAMEMTTPDDVPSSRMLHEGGQAAFAAIAEATAQLEANQQTDWSKVNIDGLRQHLVDMDNVTMRSNVSRQDLPTGARFEITSTEPSVRDSIDRMVRLHASMANEDGPYRLMPEATAGGTALTVTAGTAADQTKIRALGFFGLLTEGVHHPVHHLMIATGKMHH